MNSLGYTWNPKNWGPGSGMPGYGILTVTVPGSAWGWDEVLRRFGTMTLKETLQPAIDYAETGFPISERIAADWGLPRGLPPVPVRSARVLHAGRSRFRRDVVREWPASGSRSDLPQSRPAKTFRILQQKGRDGFYRGEIAQAIVAKSTALGGTMTLQDLANYTGEWVDASTTNYHGYDVFTLPPPAQTWATAEILNILEACVPKWAPGQTLATLGPANPKYWHMVVEAKKLAYKDLYAYNADPNFATVPVARLLSKAHASSLCGLVDPNRATATRARRADDASGDTIVLSTADRFGNMVSWVNSNYSQLRLGPDRAGLRVRPAQPRRAVHAGSEHRRMRSRRTSGRSTRCRRDS